jgi:starch-binding outer membrane protein, SusD/RagB family
MKQSYRKWPIVALLAFTTACSDWLSTQPQTILTDDQVWGDPALIMGVLADFYDRVPQQQGLENNRYMEFSVYDEGLASGVSQANSAIQNYAYGRWGVWAGVNGYGLIRDIHVAMDGIRDNTTGSLTPQQRQQFLAELRFIRAWMYFELAKRNGGVPLITEQQIYDFSGDVTPLHVPRAQEAEVYDFIGSELDAIMDQLGNAGNPRRANRAAALALKSRAMLYAGSIARHNREMPAPITLPGGEVGIPATRAVEYYTKSLEASRALINGGTHSLAPRGSFHQIFVTKNNNEVILAKDYAAGQGKNHWFTMRNLPVTMRVDQYMAWSGPEISATANVLETFDYLDGSSGELRGVGLGGPIQQSGANWIFYDRIDQIFEGRDERMYATFLLPGGEFNGQPVRLQAGVYEWNPTTNMYHRHEGLRGTTFTDGGILTDFDGPIRQQTYQNVSGLYMKKYLDPNPGAARYAPGADTWWVIFRLGEIYMNAAEAAFELGLFDEALGYVNTLRERVGFGPNSLTLPELTRDKIRSERWSELAYEDHRLWDQKRWRTAHLIWNGDLNNPSARDWVLYPYRVVRPGHPNHGKYVYDTFVTPGNTTAREFRLGNYYSEIPESAINANPLLVRNPFH